MCDSFVSQNKHKPMENIKFVINVAIDRSPDQRMIS